MSAPTPEDFRNELLEPYLQRVAAFLRAHGGEDCPLTIPSDPLPLTLSAEERKAAWSVLCDKTIAWPDSQAWIALGAGLHLAAATALEAASRADRSGRGIEAAQRLAATREVAVSYTEGLRQAIEDMVTSGKTEEAKRLSSFRNKLLEILTLLRATGTSTPGPVTQAAPTAPSADPPPGGGPEAAATPDVSTAPDPALRPYLLRAAAFLRARGHEERPLAISFGRRTLSLSAWEHRLVWRSLCEGKDPASDWHRLIPECIAVQLALLLSLEELERAGRNTDAERAARSSLQTAVRLASGVVEGFRAQIGRSVGAGALEDAKKISALSSVFAAMLLEARQAAAEGSEGAAIEDDGSGQSASTTVPGLHSAVAGTAPAGPPERLKPFLDRAAHLLEMRGREDRPLSIPVGGRSWNLDGWERQVLWKVLCEEGPPPPDWSVLLAHGAAVQLAALLALERLRKAGAAPEARVAAEAERDAALQMASEILERMQTASETLAADGQVKLAEKLTRFRERLAELLRMLNRTRSQLSS
ncbi:MAG: hypothetical protein ABR961_08635 [Thermoanaerobaculaceae bacterium]